MKKIIFALVMLSLVLASAAGAADDELNIFIWSEYMDEENMPREFTERTGIKVRLDIYESNEEMVAKLLAGGVGQYDIIVPSDYILPILLHQNLLRPLDHKLIPNLKNLREIFRNTAYDPGNKWSAAYQWGTVGLIYREDMVRNYRNTWAMLFDSRHADDIGSFWLIDSVREMMGISLRYLGHDFNSTVPGELRAAADLLVATKKRSNCMGFKPGVGGKNDVVAGTAAAAIVYNGDAIQALTNNPDVPMKFVIPEEGGEIWYDSMCIPAKAPNPIAAHKWIDFVLDPKVGADLSNYNQYATPNQASLPFITPADLKNPGIYPDEQAMQRLFFTRDLGKDNRLMDEAWTRAKSH